MTDDKLVKMAAAGQVSIQAHRAVEKLIKPGINVLEIEKTVQEIIEKSGMKPAFLGYRGYRYASCISVNSTIVHGLPSNRVLKEGDVVSVDLGVANDGWIVDVARTHPVGQISLANQQLLLVTEKALNEAISLCHSGTTIGDLGARIQSIVEGAGLFIVRELNGHGVGRKLQEPPTIPNFGQPGTGQTLTAGQTIALEPITTTAPTDIKVLSDGWSIVGSDQVTAAHFEDTIMITDGDPLILTR